MYKDKNFEIGALEGLSENQISEHLKLYAGYVKNINLITEKLAALKENSEENALAISELRRRIGFEFNGMRMHEYYFEQLGASSGAQNGSELMKALADQFGSFDIWLNDFKQTAMTRGIGWTVLYYDKNEKIFHNVWVADHEVGQLAGLNIVLALDMWEHAFLLDYIPSQKKDYVEAFFKNLKWEVVESRFNS
jgi:Fe-Mn family superoxide dismutase